MSSNVEFEIFEVRSWVFVPGVSIAAAVSKSRVSSVKVIVSGCGVVVRSREFLGWKVNVKSWLILGGSAIVPEKW